MSTPTIGIRGTFYPGGGLPPTRAEVVHVWSDTCVNLKTAEGLPTSVLIPQAGQQPSGYYFVPDKPEPEVLVQPKITGYRQLNEAEAALMNKIKAHGVELGALVAELRDHKGLDQRWVSIGATDLQTGLMALTRAVAQPTTF